MIDVEELKARAWSIADEKAKAKASAEAVKPEMLGRAPMSAARIRAMLQILGWSITRTARELGVSAGTVNNWRRGKRPVPRMAELALLFCLIRDQPTKIRENQEILAKIP